MRSLYIFGENKMKTEIKATVGLIFIGIILVGSPIINTKFDKYQSENYEKLDIKTRYDLKGAGSWKANGTVICNASDSQNLPKICSDGTGGAIITWHDNRNGANLDVYAQMIDSNGNVNWTTNGVAIGAASGDQSYPEICSDGEGGAIIVFNDYRGGATSDIYAQRIDSNGNVQWIPNGVAICTASYYQLLPQICSDGEGGAIIIWNDFRGGSYSDIYAQRIDSNGNVQWTPNGVAICIQSYNQLQTKICSDGAGGAVIMWRDYRNGNNFDIYAQKIDSNGNTQWNANGVAICTASSDQYYPKICSDGAGGAIITWYDNGIRAFWDIYAQRIDSNGNVQWTTDGVAICTAENEQLVSQLCNDGAGGAIITWYDYRSGIYSDIYAQRINSNGNVQWAMDGVAICTAENEQLAPQICSDGAGGAIIIWNDFRSVSYSDIYAQQINSTGNVQWTVDGIEICTADNEQINPQICRDGLGSAIITWEDYRNELDVDIYAQMIIEFPDETPPKVFNINPGLIIIVVLSILGGAGIAASVYLIYTKRKGIIRVITGEGKEIQKIPVKPKMTEKAQLLLSFCPFCGIKLRVIGKYCTNCGKKMIPE